jgi:hypothetical protein
MVEYIFSLNHHARCKKCFTWHTIWRCNKTKWNKLKPTQDALDPSPLWGEQQAFTRNCKRTQSIKKQNKQITMCTEKTRPKYSISNSKVHGTCFEVLSSKVLKVDVRCNHFKERVLPLNSLSLLTSMIVQLTSLNQDSKTIDLPIKPTTIHKFLTIDICHASLPLKTYLYILQAIHRIWQWETNPKHNSLTMKA